MAPAPLVSHRAGSVASMDPTTDSRLCGACRRPIDQPSACHVPHEGGKLPWRLHPRVRPAGCSCAVGAGILVWRWCDVDDCDAIIIPNFTFKQHLRRLKARHATDTT